MSRVARALLLMLAIALPGGAQAFGLGEIRVNSPLNAPLAAQIEIVGATSDELQTLSVRIADADRFKLYKADRPSYLATVRFHIATDAQGRPVIDLRSDAAFTDPVVDLLVDVRWAAGELIRDYSLLLDPAGFAPAPAHEGAAVREAAPVRNVAVVRDAAQVTMLPAAAEVPVAVATAEPDASVYRVRTGDTLTGIVRHAGAVGDTDVRRMMIAVYRANMEAFDGNINLLHRDALLTMPSVAAMAAVDAAQARREVAEHMQAWRSGLAARAAPAPAPVPAPVPAPAPVAAPLVEEASAKPAQSTAELPPAERVASVDTSVPPLQFIAAQAPTVAAPADEQPASTAASGGAAATARHAAAPTSTALAAIALFIVLPLLLGLAIAQGLRMRATRKARPEGPAGDETLELPDLSAAPLAPGLADHAQGAGRTLELPRADEIPTVRLPACADETALMPDATQPLERPARDDDAAPAEMAAASGGTTADLPVAAPTVVLESPTVILESPTVVLESTVTDDTILDVGAAIDGPVRAEATALDYNLVDLDATAHHVHLPSDLNERASFVERRTNMVDALRSAIARDPSRNDLRVKLLETYFAAAATNRRAFADYLRQQQGDPGSIPADEWRKLEMMAQELGLQVEAPAADDDEDLAHCA